MNMATPQPTKELLAYFDALHAEHLGERAVIQGGKDAKLLAGLCASHGPARVKELMALFFESDDEFIQSAGYTVGVFVSQCGKLIARQRLGAAVTGRTVAERNLRGLQHDMAALDEHNRRSGETGGADAIGGGHEGTVTGERPGPRRLVQGLPRGA